MDVIPPSSRAILFQLFLLGFGKDTLGYLPSRHPDLCRTSFISLRTRPLYSSTTTDGAEDLHLHERRRLHEFVKVQDPEWYQEYVLDVLGEECCQSKWPAILEYSIDDISYMEERSKYIDSIPDKSITTPNATISATQQPTSSMMNSSNSLGETNPTLIRNSSTSRVADQILVTSTIDANRASRVPLLTLANETTTTTTTKTPNTTELYQATAESYVTNHDSTDFSLDDIPNTTMDNLSATTLLDENATIAPILFVSSLDENQNGTNTGRKEKDEVIGTYNDPNEKSIPQSPVSLATQNMTSDSLSASNMTSTTANEDGRTLKTSTTTTKFLPNEEIMSPSLASPSTQNMETITFVPTLSSSIFEEAGSKTVVGDTNITNVGTENITDVPNATIMTLDSSMQKKIDTISTPPKKTRLSVPKVSPAFNYTPSTITDSANLSTSKVIVYRDSKQGWKTVDVNVLIDMGYFQDEIMELQSDALAIIIQEKIRRPRTLGLPAPWRIGPKEAKALVRLVPDQSYADELVETFKKQEREQRNRRSPPRGPLSSTRTPAKPERETAMPDMTGDALDRKTRDSLQTEAKRNSNNETGNPEKDEDEATDRMDPFPTKSTVSDRKEAIPPAILVVSDTNITGSPLTDTRDPPRKNSASVLEQEPSEAMSRVVLYRDIGNSLVAIPLSNLTMLGYQEEEVRNLQGEALAIIVTDQVLRPRMGIPPQWKRTDPNEEPEIDFVDSMEEAELRVDEDKARRRRQRAIAAEPIESYFSRQDKPTKIESRIEDSLPGTRERRISRGMQNVKSQTLEEEIIDRSQENPVGDENDTVERPRSTNRNRRQSRSDKRAFGVNEEDLVESRQRSRRFNVNDDGSPKRIYNARSIPNRRDSEGLSDPPDPNSPLWMDMDTFRSLLRSEAELRLRILGDDWAPTVKQESDWRLNLYKNWLWTLHNGVGESIVPPSRYERARKSNERRERRSEQTAAAEKPKTLRKSGKRRPKNM